MVGGGGVGVGLGVCLWEGVGWCMAPPMYQLSLRAETGKLGGKYDLLLHCECAHTDTHTYIAEVNKKHFFQTRDVNENFSYSILHIEKFWHSISGFEARPRKNSFNLRHQDEIEIHYF